MTEQMPKLLFIQPTQYSPSTGKPIKMRKMHVPCLAFPYLASFIPDKWEIEIVFEVIEDVNLDSDADLVGIGAMGQAIFRAMDLVKEFKQRGKKVFMGGYMPSMNPDFALQHADSIIIGDAEKSIVKLLDDFERTGEIDSLYNNPLNSLKGLPIPKYEFFLNRSIGKMLPVWGSRGCPHTCSFCSIACIHKGRYMVRPVEEVINDIKAIKELGYNQFFLVDDNIMGKPYYLEEFCRYVKPLNMAWVSQSTINLANNKDLLNAVAGSGCWGLNFGLESIHQESVTDLDKGWLNTENYEELIKRVSDSGILPSISFMFGTDEETEESFDKTMRFINKTRIPLLRLYIMTPVRGTRLFNKLRAENRLLHEDFELYNSVNCVHIPRNINPDKLDEKFRWIIKKAYSWSSILKRTLLNRMFFKYPRRYFFAFTMNLYLKHTLKKGDAPVIV